jgi:hypothetical protein
MDNEEELHILIRVHSAFFQYFMPNSATNWFFTGTLLPHYRALGVVSVSNFQNGQVP